jgi:parallel beta-helix repeat protein
MTQRIRLYAALLAAPLLGYLVLHATPAAADTVACTQLGTLPATISAPGVYCLNANFSQDFTTAAVTIAASNVVLDCNDHVVTQAGTSAVSGVFVHNRSLVTVRNCGLNGFGRGITYLETHAGYSRNHRVTGNDVRRSRLVGIQVAGSGSVIEDNRVSENIGGAAAYTFGILLSSAWPTGVGNVIRNNLVTYIAPSLYVRIAGIYVLDVDNTLIVGNTITALFPPAGQGVYGIVGSPGSLGNAAVDNTVLSAIGDPPGQALPISYGGANYGGIRFDADLDATRRNLCRGNVVGHFISNILAESATVGCAKDANIEF